jgi:hypothetical protein
MRGGKQKPVCSRTVHSSTVVSSRELSIPSILAFVYCPGQCFKTLAWEVCKPKRRYPF